MSDKILVVYKSVTGFTKQYAEMIAQEANCELINLKNASAKVISQYDTVVFGSRFYAGTIDGLKKVKTLVEKSNVKNFVIFATGATPNVATEAIEETWQRNLTAEELQNIPHFYMQGGLRYEKMPMMEKMMMKAFASFMKKKKDQTEEDKELIRMISTSYDISSKEYIEPLVSSLKEKK